jgi:hypothetical protein
MCGAADRSHKLNHRKLERDLQPTHHAQEPSIGFWPAILSEKPPLGTAIFQKLNATNHPNKLYPMPVSYSCSANNHHNCRHRIIIPLNTRISDNHTSRLTPLHRSDNPLPKTRTNFLLRKSGEKTSTRIQTHQNLFTLTKNFRPSTSSWEQTSDLSGL